jgi:NAD(P)-dependent dehydrogenase (short-subunit alcohol dehydrogenase family)
MELRGTTFLLLGGSGLVGMAVARRLIPYGPRKLIIAGLYQEEAETGADELRREAAGIEIEAVWGNIFLPADLATRPRSDVMSDPVMRRRLVDELLGPATGDAMQQNLMFVWLMRYRPDAVVDCINTATALAYQDLFASSSALLAAADAGQVTPEAVERHVLTLPLPQLIRHVQIMFEGMGRAKTSAYVKIGTSGTGGMGFNIPYTHSEERPSRTLMSKSAVAGAQSLFLFLLGRTPDAPSIIEVKPTAAIAWREIAYGTVRRSGRPIELCDCTEPQPLKTAFAPGAGGWKKTGQSLESVFINVGENGVFARDEFETVSALGQMELVTPEEIADTVVHELMGRPTGKNIVAALDGASFGPTYRAGYLRAVALSGLTALEQKHGVRSIAFEMLGPPRLTKLLYEAYILGRLYPSVKALAAAEAKAVSAGAKKLLLDGDVTLRRQIISVGIPILMPDGQSVLRGEVVVVPPGDAGVETAQRGWVDLRQENCAKWIERAVAIAAVPPDTRTGSSARWSAVDPGAPIEPARMAVWVFENEDGGYRIKR